MEDSYGGVFMPMIGPREWALRLTEETWTPEQEQAAAALDNEERFTRKWVSHDRERRKQAAVSACDDVAAAGAAATVSAGDDAAAAGAAAAVSAGDDAAAAGAAGRATAVSVGARHVFWPEHASKPLVDDIAVALGSLKKNHRNATWPQLANYHCVRSKKAGGSLNDGMTASTRFHIVAQGYVATIKSANGWDAGDGESCEIVSERWRYSEQANTQVCKFFMSYLLAVNRKCVLLHPSQWAVAPDEVRAKVEAVLHEHPPILPMPSALMVVSLRSPEFHVPGFHVFGGWHWDVLLSVEQRIMQILAEAIHKKGEKFGEKSVCWPFRAFRANLGRGRELSQALEQLLPGGSLLDFVRMHPTDYEVVWNQSKQWGYMLRTAAVSAESSFDGWCMRRIASTDGGAASSIPPAAGVGASSGPEEGPVDVD